MDRNYKVEVVMTGNPPEPGVILKDSGGKVIGPLDPIVFNKDKDGMKKVDYYELKFKLHHANQTNLRFLTDKDNVMWVHGDVEQCPQSNSSNSDFSGVFWVSEVDSDGEWVKIVNMDMVVQTFRFQLNLADKNIQNPTAADYVSLDPVGDNQDRGGLGTRTPGLYATAVGVGIVAGLVAFAAARAFLPSLGW
ncbi:MAG TPA: hypothetical protein VH392_05685 [Sphingomicrobium sp.]|jgi:hypothetical protein